MRNPYVLPGLPEGKQYAIIQGFVIAVKDRGDANMILFREDTMDTQSPLVSVAAWGLSEGQSGTDMKAITEDLKGKFVVCVVGIREKEQDGKVYRNYDLKYIVRTPQNRNTA